MVTNNAVTPLILVDGDEITGAKQNRIVNTTILIPPKTTMAVSVSCTEHGRWHFKGHTKNETIFALLITLQILIQDVLKLKIHIMIWIVKLQFGIQLVKLNQEWTLNQLLLH